MVFVEVGQAVEYLCDLGCARRWPTFRPCIAGFPQLKDGFAGFGGLRVGIRGACFARSVGGFDESRGVVREPASQGVASAIGAEFGKNTLTQLRS